MVATANLPSVRTFPGWRVVGAAFMCLFTTAGLGFYGLAVYLPVLSREQGWSVSSISRAVTVFFVVGGVAGVVVARLLARHDVRVVVMGGALVGAVALALLGRVADEWHVFVVYILLSIGHTAAGLVPVTTVVTRWFHVRRSVALSVASTGLSVGGMVLTPTVKWLLDDRGLAAGAPWLAAMWLVGIVPATLLFLRDDPADAGFAPDGARLSDGAPPAVLSVDFAAAVRSRFFIAVTVAYTFIFAAQVGGIQHLVKLVEERSSTSLAATATLVLAASSVVARLAGGQLTMRLPMLGFTVCCAVVQGASLLFIASFEVAGGLMASIALFGATVGNLLMLHPLLVGAKFGPRDYPRIFSRSQLIVFVGTAAGPSLLGVLHDAAGDYLTAYLVAGTMSLVGAVVLSRAGALSRA
jgi:MFS family permease